MIRTVVFISLTLRASAMETFPNAILSEPEVRCGNDDVTIAVITDNKKPSHIFAKGHASDQHCVFRDVDKASFSLSRCGMSRKRQLDPKGLMFNLIVIVQLHPLFVTKVDKAYNLKCFYMELDRTVSNQIDISAIPTQPMKQFSEMPICTYKLLAGTPEGEPVRFARVGDKVFHVWDCPSPMYGMLVHSCMVTSGDGQEQMIIDENGCGVDQYLIGTPNYTPTATTAIQETHVFKFADRVTVMFNCQIKLCMRTAGSCDGITPPVCGSSSGGGTGSKASGGAGGRTGVATGNRAGTGTEPFLVQDNTEATQTIPPATDSIADFTSPQQPNGTQTETHDYVTADGGVSAPDTTARLTTEEEEYSTTSELGTPRADTHFTLPTDTSFATTTLATETTYALNDSVAEFDTTTKGQPPNEGLSTVATNDVSDVTDLTTNVIVADTPAGALTTSTRKMITFPSDFTPFITHEGTEVTDGFQLESTLENATSIPPHTISDSNSERESATLSTTTTRAFETSTGSVDPSLRNDVLFDTTPSELTFDLDLEEMLNGSNSSTPFPLGPLAESLLLDDTSTVFTLMTNDTALNETVLERLALEKNSFIETSASDVTRVVAGTRSMENETDGEIADPSTASTLPPHIVQRLVRRFQTFNEQQAQQDRLRRDTLEDLDLAMDVQQRMIVLEPSDVDDDTGPAPGRLALTPSHGSSKDHRTVCLSRADLAGLIVAIAVILTVCGMFVAWVYRRRRTTVETTDVLPRSYEGFR